MAFSCRSPALSLFCPSVHLFFFLATLLLLASGIESLSGPLTSGRSSRSLPPASGGSMSDAVTGSSFFASNYSFPDAAGGVKSAQLINETSSITGPNGQHMHLEEGDVVVPDLQSTPAVNDISQDSPQAAKGKMAKYAIRDDYRIWPKGRIPYVIEESLWSGRPVILRAMKHIMSKTCITFVPRRKGERNFIRLYQGSYRSCFSMIGRVGGGQGISLGSGCLVHGVVIHELMHAIGFFHMHSRSDRDRYLKILWPNIDQGMQSQFRRNAKNQDILFRPFDYRSIMLYGPKLFSSNGQDTMIPLKRGARLLDTGVKKGLSDEDARSINMLYGCQEPMTTTSTTTTTTTTPEPTTTSTLAPTTVFVSDAKPTKRRRRKFKPRRKWHQYFDKLRT